MIKKPRTYLNTRFLIGALSFIFMLSVSAPSQNVLPPLIDREVLFGNPEIAGAQISPDGTS